MKLTTREIINNMPRLAEVAQKELPIKVSYAISKNIAKIDSEMKIYNALREKLVQKYAVKDDAGKLVIDDNNQLTIPKENMDDWNRDMEELMNIEHEIDVHKFQISLLDGYKLSPAHLAAIEYMIEE